MAERGRTLKVQVVGDIADIKKDLKSVDQSMSGLDKSAKAFGKTAKVAGAAIAGAFAVDSVVDFAKGAIDAASDLNESMSKVDVVFGKSADEIKRWSKTSADSVLLSQQAALEAAGTFGNLFDALDLTEQATVDMSKGAVQLAADLASFNNVPVEETLLAIRSGLLGEAEPMRKFGSALSAQRVEAYALAKGWVQNKRDLTEAMKVQARYELILEDTVNAQGDVARTSDGLANSQKRLDANMQNLSASIGQALVGPLAGFTNWLSELVGSGGNSGFLNAAADGVERLRKEQEKLVEAQPEEGQWLGTGTVFDSAVDGLTMLSEGLLRAVISTDEWVDRFTATRKVTVATEEDLYRLAKQIMDVGGTYEDFAIIVGTAQTQMESQRTAAAILTDAWTGITPAVEKVADVVETVLPAATKAAVKDVKVDLGSLVGISRNTLQSTRDEIADRMADIQDALRHPFRDDKLEKEYRSAIRKGTAAMNRALKQGNEEAYAEASEFVRKYKAKLRELQRQKWRVNVEMRIQRSGYLVDQWGINPNKPEPRASGGPVTKGMPYVVGEKRPELFVPNQSGRIEPKVGGSGATYNLTVNGFVGSEAQLGREIARVLREYEKRGGPLWRLTHG